MLQFIEAMGVKKEIDSNCLEIVIFLLPHKCGSAKNGGVRFF
jgi:hypothetical protein